jgi:hypothetical protein
MELVVLIRLALRSSSGSTNVPIRGIALCSRCFRCPMTNKNQSFGFFQFRYSRIWRGRKQGDALLRGSLSKRGKSRRMTVLPEPSHHEADYRFSNWKEGRRRPRTVKWWFVMLGDDERGL